MNGSGYATGIITGITTAVLQRIIYPDINQLLQFAIVSTLSLTGVILGTYISKPTDAAILEKFYRRTRPFGLWKPLKKKLPPDIRHSMEKEQRRDIAAIPFAFGFQLSLFFMPMLLIIHSFKAFFTAFAVFSISLTALYFIWLRHLVKKEDIKESELI